MRAVPFEYEKAGSALSYESRLQYLIQSEKPDVIISVNMLGFDGNGMLPELAARSGIPVVVWFVDDPHPILLHQRQFINKNMAAFCWERAYLPFLKSSGFGSVKYLPLAADPEMFPIYRRKVFPVQAGFCGEFDGKEISLRNRR
jgi:predicted glycosyltransferase